MQSLSGYKAVMRGVGGLCGGILGTVIIATSAVVSSNLIKSVFAEGVPNMFVNMIFLITFFFASIASALVSILIMSKTDNERFYYLGPALMKMAIVNIVLFALLTPVYFIGGSFNVAFIPIVGVIHFIFSSVFSFMLFDLEARTDKKPILSLFSTLVGGLFGGILVMLFFFFAGGEEFLAFLVPLVPLVMWISMSALSAGFEMLYYYIYSSYGLDLFASSGYDRVTYEQQMQKDAEAAALAEEEKSRMR
jgi:hypothetical protein